ncbi:hypothetical protein LMH87_010861 [Akanthomyces muscarius]|uniref:Uncharacterized protein n=1 Tax=Akanthomyces muscarius TaxID=2231603 RepID=A0A9W8UKJ0_AKAMU|nr:hypothetical protein LMH87_010861 [Akanthomyces muscarius]KAJ4150095.1 hypothetical protein LMH87_010861 [Akanthomyces muscarius]
MIWPCPSSSPDPEVEACFATTTIGDDYNTPFWTQNSAWMSATDHNDQDDDDIGDDDDNLAWSQPPSPAWETNNLAESPFIPSAQPVFYPFSLPASGIRPLTPPSPFRQRLDSSDSWISELDTDSEVDDLLDDLLQSVSGMAL